MSAKPTVSVIMPTYNRAAVLRESLLDLLKQTWRPLEVVIVNDGSSDDTEGVLTDMRPMFEAGGIVPNFAVQTNAGAAAARNRAMANATGEYLAFLDDDDRWMHDKLELQLKALAESGAKASVCRVASRGGKATTPRNAGGLPRGLAPGKWLAREADFHIIGLVVHSSSATMAGEFDTSLKTGEDTEWLARLMHLADFAPIETVLAEYRLTPGSLSDGATLEQLVRRDTDQRRALNLIRERCEALPGWDAPSWRKRVAQDYDQFVKHMLYVGDVKGAQSAFKSGMELCGGVDPLPRVRSKLRKAWWLALIGKRIRHPKLGASPAGK